MDLASWRANQSNSVHARLRWAVACGAALVAIGTRAVTVPLLGDPPTCIGLVDYLAVRSARLLPDVPVAALLSNVDTAALALAGALTALLTVATSGSLAAGSAMAVVVLLSPAFDPVAGTLPGLGLLAGVLTLSGAIVPSSLAAGLGLGLAAAVWPDLWLPLTLVMALHVFVTRPPRAVFAWTAAIPLISLVVTFLVAPWGPDATSTASACLWPSFSSGDAGASLGGVLAATGPYAAGLGALGLASLDRHLWPRALVALGYGVASSFGEATPGSSLSISASVLLGLGAGRGLSVIRQASGRTWSGATVALLFTLLAPALVYQSWSARHQGPPAVDRGHRGLTLHEFERRLDQLPPKSGLVLDDSVTTHLVRAARRDVALLRPTAAPRSVMPRDGLDRAFAMPRTQVILAGRGFEVIGLPDAPGFARLARRGDCRTVTDAWRVVADLRSALGLSIAARSSDETGPVIVYASFAAPPNVHPVDWPTPRTRGLLWTNYSLADEASAARLAGDTRADRLDAAFPPAGSTHAVRLEMWRPPGAPLVLTAGVGVPIIDAYARVRADAEPPRATVCPAFPTEVRGFF